MEEDEDELIQARGEKAKVRTKKSKTNEYLPLTRGSMKREKERRGSEERKGERERGEREKTEF